MQVLSGNQGAITAVAGSVGNLCTWLEGTKQAGQMAVQQLAGGVVSGTAALAVTM